MIDVIVVGSGPGGTIAAARLIESGRSVLMLDFGNRDARYAELVPERPFLELRHEDREQHRYLLGETFEGIPFGAVRVGAQLTPPRSYALADAAERMPVDAPGFAVSMSLARGGLGVAWGAGVFPFSDDELRTMGLDLATMQPHYDAVAARIGVAGAQDDLLRFYPSTPGMMPALDADTNGSVVLARYLRHRARLNAAGFYLGRPRIAVCSEPFRGREAYAYYDLDFWADVGRSIYRPMWTLDELERRPGFTYRPRCLVRGFVEQETGVRVEATHADTGARERHEARALVLAAGTFGTARLVLRSLERYDTPVPLVSNPYTYVPTLNLGMVGRPTRDPRSSQGQLTAILERDRPGHHLVQAQVFSYRSLLTFKLMKELPLAARESRRMLQVLMPCFAILGIHHEDRPSPAKMCMLRRAAADGPDTLAIRYQPSEEEEHTQREDERVLLRCFRRLGCVALKSIRPGHGSSIHYAGTFPITAEDRPLTCDRDSRLRGTRAVYLADGSVFPWLPPKGLTFNIMANADRVGAVVAERLR
jgi:choline dehydrogenase-like flavoprotein